QIRATRKLIKSLGDDHTLLLSTHILPEVEAICTRAVVIARGKIVAQGKPDELRSSRRMESRVLVECRGPALDVENALSRVSGVAKVEAVAADGGDRDYVSFALRPRE